MIEIGELESAMVLFAFAMFQAVVATQYTGVVRVGWTAAALFSGVCAMWLLWHRHQGVERPYV